MSPLHNSVSLSRSLSLSNSIFLSLPPNWKFSINYYHTNYNHSFLLPHITFPRTQTQTKLNVPISITMEAPIINDSTFSSANPSSYSLSEIWPMPLPHTNVPPFPDPDASPDNSTVTDHTPNHIHRNKRKDAATSHDHSSGSKNDSSNKHIKLAEADASSAAGNKLAEQSAKPSEPPKQDYIHVRARRGQATDSHSLAERARREKISERMKILQDLVPGCNKVIGKALVLDEIINYIQSLQRQTEFLSMKLEAVNSRLNMNPTIECFPSKDVDTQPLDLAGMIFGSQTAREYAQGSQPGWLHMQIGGGFERAT